MSEHSLTLYDLETELMETFEHVTQLQAEGNEEDLAAALQALELYIKESVQKRDRVGKFIESLVATQTSIDTEIERLQDRKKRIAKAEKSMRNYILLVMSRIGVSKLEGQLFSFKARKNPPSVSIDDVTKIPAWYMTVTEPPPPPPLRPDKNTIREAIESGHEVPGARLVQETRLVIDQ